MDMFCCVLKTPGDIGSGGTASCYIDGDKYYSNYLQVNLPTELLVKILLYLSISDRIRMRYVCRKFRDIGKTPLLWRNFVWSYGPHHVRMVSNLLKAYGEHVRQIYYPDHVMPQEILEMVCYCAKVTHLSLPRDTRLTLDQLEKIIHMMTHLQQLEVFTQGNFVKSERISSVHGDKFIETLLKVTAASVKDLKLRIYRYQLVRVLTSIKEWADGGHPLPSIINICCETKINVIPDQGLLKFCSKLPSCEIGFYDNEKLPINLYPLVPVRKFILGPAATPPFMRLSDHGIVGLEDEVDIFHLCEYNHHGTIRHAITPAPDLNRLPIEDKHLTHIDNFNSVSYVDISYLNLHSDHLEQLAIACPNLQRLGIQGNSNCLEDLHGLRAIVHTCQNLKILNLNEISVSRVESHLLLWELLSSVKRLSYLAVDLCMVKLSDSNDANKQKLIAMFKQCHKLQAIEIQCIMCRECNSGTDFLFSYFSSLVHCELFNFRYSGFMYAVSNCQKLKYLHEHNERILSENILHPLINNCQLQRLNITMTYLNVSNEVVKVLSAHGELESVTLNVKSITFDGICTLIMNSPNLTSLHVKFRIPLFDEVYLGSHDYTSIVWNKLSMKYHKLFDLGGKMMILRTG